ncbi:MAG: TerC family protein [Pseudomonadota bacterium]
MIDFLMTALSGTFMGHPTWMWASFLAIVLALLFFDLFVLNRKDHVIGMQESLKLYGFYVFLATCFGAWVWYSLGATKGMEYFTGYIIEATLSMDNLFVMALVLSYFGIPREYQHRVLFWGILGVIVLRGIMIALGATLVAQFHWVLYIFAAFLIVTGVKMLLAAGDGDNDTLDLSQNRFLIFIKKHMRVTNELHGHNFIVRKTSPETGQLVTYATPLLLALILIEFADLVFAVDSVPAIFAITTDAYIIYTSNIFAILGLRSLFFALSAMMARFTYLKYAISIVLVFIGSKIFIVDFMDWNKFPPALSLGITVGILASGVLYSLWKTRDTAPTLEKQ